MSAEASDRFGALHGVRLTLAQPAGQRRQGGFILDTQILYDPAPVQPGPQAPQAPGRPAIAAHSQDNP